MQHGNLLLSGFVVLLSDFNGVKEMTKNTHPHAAFITEAMQDMSREFECSGNNGLNWSHSDLVSLICAGETWQFRFKPVKPAVVSTLTDDEIEDLYQGWHSRTSVVTFRRLLADTAAAAERERIAKLPAVSNITIFSGGYTYEKLGELLNSAITQFLKDLEDGKL